jgi:hypothetical protein
MEYHAEPMTTTATTKVSVLLNTQDDWWNWNRKIIKLARDHETLDILLRRVPRPVEPTHPNDFEPDLTNQNAALSRLFRLFREQERKMNLPTTKMPHRLWQISRPRRRPSSKRANRPQREMTSKPYIDVD